MLTVALLGRAQIALNDEPITDFVSDKVLGLLGYLVLRPGPHARETLADLLWGEMPERRAKANLRMALYNLQQLLPGYFAITHKTAAFKCEQPHWLDVAVLEHIRCGPELEGDRLRGAIELYRGEFLEGLMVEGAPAFEVWLHEWRERLHLLALEALAKLAKYHMARAEWEAAIAATQHYLAMQPWSEEAHRQLMLLLARTGQYSAALAQYKRCRQLLADELDVEPLPETIALHERIRAARRQRRRHNLPAWATPFVGRETELAQLRQILTDPCWRLITLSGPGGIGKTRLALQAASEQLDHFLHGVVFVALAPVRGVDLLVSAIAHALQLEFHGPADPICQLLAYLREKELLLILDSFEHLMGACNLLVEILAHAPDVKILVTSQERLNFQEERLLDLQGLQYPDDLIDGSIEGYSAVQLFLQSAANAHSSGVLAPAAYPAIVRICQLVEGMPLAIELAASWVRVLSCQEIAAEIERNLSFLTTSLRNVPDRHHSLQAVFDYSWHLLSEEERRIVRHLAVFCGGFRAVAAQEVSGASLQHLLAFVDKSLLRRTDVGRYEMHELLRQYALERLVERGEATTTRQAHAAYYLRLVERLEPELWAAIPAAQARLEEEYGNLSAALVWSLEHEEAAMGLRLAGTLGWFWFCRRDWGEGRGWLERLLAGHEVGPSAVRGGHADGGRPQQPQVAEDAARPCIKSLAKALHSAGLLAWFQGDYRAAYAHLEVSVALWRQAEDQQGLAIGLTFLGLATSSVSGAAAACPIIEQGLALFRALKDSRGTGLALFILGVRAVELGDYATARVMLTESLVLHRQLATAGFIVDTILYLGLAAFHQGDLLAAQAAYEESLSMARERGDQWSCALALTNLGELARYQGDYEGAAAHYRESIRLFEQLGCKGDIARQRHNLAYVALRQGTVAQAQQLFQESLLLFQNLRMERGIAECLVGLAGVASAMPIENAAARGAVSISGCVPSQADVMRAARLLGAAEALRTATRSLMWPADQVEHQCIVSAIRVRLDETTFAAAWNEGRVMSMEQAVACALEMDKPID